jgi:FolB domain-containing protein
MTPGKIIIQDLAVEYCVGITEAERSRPQKLMVCLELDTDFEYAIQTDDIQYTIDYFAICQRLLTLGQGNSWKLIETLADQIGHIVIDDFGAHSVTVEVRKFIIPQTQYVAVRLTKTR